jgi:hypothetical protein
VFLTNVYETKDSFISAVGNVVGVAVGGGGRRVGGLLSTTKALVKD